MILKGVLNVEVGSWKSEVGSHTSEVGRIFGTEDLDTVGNINSRMRIHPHTFGAPAQVPGNFPRHS